MKCLFCGIRKKMNLTKCKFCEHYDSQEMLEGLGYLKNAFARIDNELDDLEGKVHVVIGSLFKRHKYSAEDLLDSLQMNRIKSLAGKIKDDVSLWESAGKLLYRMKIFYNDNTETVQNRLRMINQMIQERKPTLWESVGGFFRSLYRAIVELLPVICQTLLFGRKSKSIRYTA